MSLRPPDPARRDDANRRLPRLRSSGHGRPETRGSIRVTIDQLGDVTSPSWCVHVDPIDTADVMRAWRSQRTGRTATTRVLALTTPAAAASADAVPLDVVADVHGVPIAERLEGGVIVLEETTVAALLAALRMDGVPRLLVRLDGPLEDADARALLAALRRGASPLDADVRAVTAIERTGATGELRAWSRDPDGATAFAGESFRRLVACLRAERPEAVAAPDGGLLARLLDRTGGLEIRPRETEVYSTAIDVAIRPGSAGSGPATESIVYDLFADTWHGD